MVVKQIQYFATVARGLEAIAAQELERLGAVEVVPGFAGVHFQGDHALLYRVNLWSRLVFRVLMPLYTVKSASAPQLYHNVYHLDWSDYLAPHQTFAVHCTGGNQKLNHTHFTALQIKNAIVDRQSRTLGKRSDIDPQDPDLLINAHIEGDRCILSLDSSGGSLHRRGYRPAMGLAPLKETLAAALLEMAQWHPSLPFLDPLCGSGSLPIEAALKSLNIAPGLYRRQFGFQRWQDFDRALWQELVGEAQASQQAELAAPILGNDKNWQVLQQAQVNAAACGLQDRVQWLQADFCELEAMADAGIIICNPPYGKRMGDEQELKSLYKALGDVFKQRFKGWTAYILTGNRELAKHVGLKASRRIPVYNGSLPCTLLKYELY
jgi:putative N6-adenine-specific DNA methylase